MLRPSGGRFHPSPIITPRGGTDRGSSGIPAAIQRHSLAQFPGEESGYLYCPFSPSKIDIRLSEMILLRQGLMLSYKEEVVLLPAPFRAVADGAVLCA